MNLIGNTVWRAKWWTCTSRLRDRYHLRALLLDLTILTRFGSLRRNHFCR